MESVQKNKFDAIVIGSGISGGWAAKELCEAGLKTLVLERGRDVKHVKDYPTAMKDPWEFTHGNKIPKREANPIVSKCYAYDAGIGRPICAVLFAIFGQCVLFRLHRPHHVSEPDLAF